MTLRLMVLSDRMLGGTSAYSKVTYETCTRLAKLGHQVAHIPMGMANRMGKQVYENVLVYPSGTTPWGEDVAPQHYLDFKADMLITIKEPWVFKHLHKEGINFVPMAIIDHSPVSPSITARLDTAFKVIAISRFGQGQLRGSNIKSYYIPHGVRTEIYKPLTEHKADCRKLWFLDPDEFVVGIVAMNRARKMIPRMLRGYKQFCDWNPDVKTHLMLWTDIRGVTSLEEALPPGVADVGVNLLPEIMNLGLGEAVRWTKMEEVKKMGGLPEWIGNDYKAGWDMVKLYNTLDCLLLCSGGEGAGLPFLEAGACGVIGITTDYAGGPEYVGSGLTVRADDYVVLNTPGTRYALASIDKMAEALTKVLNADRSKLGRKARRFAERFSWDRIVEAYWKPFLQECKEELYPKLSKEGGLSSWA